MSFIPRWVVSFCNPADEGMVDFEIFDNYEDALAYYDKLPGYYDPSLTKFKKEDFEL